MGRQACLTPLGHLARQTCLGHWTPCPDWVIGLACPDWVIGSADMIEL